MSHILVRTIIAILTAILISQAASAQVVTITNTNYTPPNNNVNPPIPPKARPEGTWSVPVRSGNYRVTVFYGTLNVGIFTEDVTIGIGQTLTLPIRGGNGTYSFADPDQLKNPLPVNAAVKVALQKYNAGTNDWNEVHQAYRTLP